MIKAKKGIANLSDGIKKSFLTSILETIQGKPKQDIQEKGATNFWEYYYLASLNLQNRDFNQALKLAQISKEKNSEFIWTYKLIGDIYQGKNNHQKAVDFYEIFLQKNTNNLSALINIAISYDFLKEYQKAEKTYLYILENYPSEATALNNLAWLYLTSFTNEDHKEKALLLSQQAVKIHENAANLDTLAEAQYQNGNYKQALVLIEKSLVLDKQNLDHFKKQRVKFLKALKSEIVP